MISFFSSVKISLFCELICKDVVLNAGECISCLPASLLKAEIYLFLTGNGNAPCPVVVH